MGSGTSSEAVERRPATAQPQKKQRYLIKGSGENGERPATAQSKKAAGSRGANSVNTAAAQKLNSRKKRAAEDDDDLKTLTRTADPVSLQVLQILEEVEALPANKAAQKINLLQKCYPLLEKVPKERFDQLTMMVYQKEGEVYHKQGEIESAKDVYARAITLAEKRVARGEPDVYMVLKRYVLSMVGLARIWYEHEKEIKGFQFADPRHPKVPAVEGDGTESDASSSLSSLENSLSSAGSVFSLNEAILKSMAPRQPRSRTGPNFTRVKMRAPHEIKESKLNNREDQFVLHSKMTRELVASPCELLLLRCCEVVEIGHNCQSELLIPALIELAQIYEDLELYSRALLLVRRCLGILCNVYDYDHPWVIELQRRADRLRDLLEQQLREEAATKIQATWKMHRAMRDLEEALGHPVKRHVWIPRKYRNTPDLDFLGDLDDLPQQEEQDEPEEPDDDFGALVPQPVQMPPVMYNPVECEGEVVTFTTMVPNAKVLGTTQDTETDTHIQQTELGDILTIRTTTVTRTLTENVDDEQEDFEALISLDYEESSDASGRNLPPAPVRPQLEYRQSPAASGPGKLQPRKPQQPRNYVPSTPSGSVQSTPRNGEPLCVCPYCSNAIPCNRCPKCARIQPVSSFPISNSPNGPHRLCPFCRQQQPPVKCPTCNRNVNPIAAPVPQAPSEDCPTPSENSFHQITAPLRPRVPSVAHNAKTSPLEDPLNPAPRSAPTKLAAVPSPHARKGTPASPPPNTYSSKSDPSNSNESPPTYRVTREYVIETRKVERTYVDDSDEEGEEEEDVEESEESEVDEEALMQELDGIASGMDSERNLGEQNSSAFSPPSTRIDPDYPEYNGLDQETVTVTRQEQNLKNGRRTIVTTTKRRLSQNDTSMPIIVDPTGSPRAGTSRLTSVVSLPTLTSHRRSTLPTPNNN